MNTSTAQPTTVSASQPNEALRVSDPDFLETLARGLNVMLAMGQSGGTIASLAKATSLPRPSVRRVLYTLVRLGYAKEQGKTFELTSQVTRFATAFLGTAGRYQVLQGRCDELSKELGEIVTVSVLDGDEQLHVAFGVPPNFVGVALGVGSRIPSYMTAAGRLLWALKPTEEVDAFIDRIHPQARTANTLTEKTSIRAAIELARSHHFATADAEYSEEFKGVAYPIFGLNASVFGALTVNARKSPALTSDAFDKLARRCKVEASRLSQEVGL